MSLALILSFVFHTNSAFRKFYTQTVFAGNAPVTKINADVLGYTMRRQGGHRGPSTFSYIYGFTYSFGGQKYYGTGYAVEGVPGDYTAYTPLEPITQVYVNTNNPAQYGHVTQYYGMQSYFNFGVVVYILFLAALCVTSFGIRLGNDKKSDPFKDRYAYLMAILVAGFPVYFIITAHMNLYTGQTADNFTGYTPMHKSPKSSANQKTYMNMDLMNPSGDNRYYGVTGLETHKIQKLFVKSDTGKPIDLRFVPENRNILIYDPADFSIKNRLIYVVSDVGQFVIPLEMIQYDFDYKT